MTDYAEILYERDGPVAVITLNRPETLNALTDLTQAEVRHALDASERDPDVVGTVLTGAGRGFCSGVDMNALSAMSEAGGLIRKSHDHLKADPGNVLDDPNYKWAPAYFLGLRKPLIAAVNGACAGLGFSYATFCDMRFMAKGARVVTSFSPRGLVAEHGTSWMLPRLVGPSNALDMVWSSRRIEAEEAFRMGWANRLSEPGECSADAIAYLKAIAETAAPMSLMMMKRQVWRHLNRDLAEAMRESTAWTEESLARPDFKEGVASFVEKRPPRFAKVSAGD
ncbi:MAG: enoyl-CoA hydratase-related protein [Phenylobacterium sp.]